MSLTQLSQQASLAGTKYWMRLAERRAKLNASGRVLKRRTGKLAGSIRSFARKSPHGVDFGLFVRGPAAFYGNIWENTGIRRHFVAPVRKKVLSWVGPDGKRRFSRGHFIPRQAPRPFMKPAIADTRRRGEARIAQEQAKALAKGLDRTITVRIKPR